MRQTDFALYLGKFLTDYLPNKKGSSPRTISSYRYAFLQLLDYYENVCGIPTMRLSLADLTYTRILGFLDWLQKERGVSASTRNQRQAALNSFLRFLVHEMPDHLNEYQRILGIPVKRAPKKEISYLKADGVTALMESIDITRGNGLRDYVMLLLLHTTGIRVSELIGIRLRDLSLYEPYTLLVHGKGEKSRYVPLSKDTVTILRKYLDQTGRTAPERMDGWLFRNHMGEPLTRQGVYHVVRKYGNLAREKAPALIPRDLSPHKMRHTTAMGLINSGVNILYIRDLLGHASVRTTEIYARADAKLKREAIEAAGREIVPPEEACWDNDADLRAWLKQFGSR